MKIVGRPVWWWKAGEPADVPAVAHGEERKHRDLPVLRRVERSLEGVEGELVAQQPVGELVPQRLRDEVPLR